MKENVFFIPIADFEADELICQKLAKAIKDNDWLAFVKDRDLVAFKTHFGEENTQGYVRPLNFIMLAGLVKKKNAQPFLTDTATLYSGLRANAVGHIELAQRHGFGFENTQIPLIMADGLTGDEEIDVPIPGRLYQKVKIASLIVKAQSLVVVSHFTGHMVSGFGAALKNMGMGCSSRRGKLAQHSTATPSVKKKKCNGCASCATWCPAQAITMKEQIAQIDKKKCIGCAECLTVCRFDAIGYNWSETYEQLQRKIVEHAWGVALAKQHKVIYINFLNRISKDCDCIGGFKKISPDIGVLIAFDPVALDAASLDLVEQKTGRLLSQLSFDIPYRVQIDYAREIGFGNSDYQLVEI
ncbi:MAG: DUF362 domain-containing protein [Chrysiogenales bacterium]